MKQDILEIAQDLEKGTISEDRARNLLLGLFSVSKRFNFPNFIAGVMVGILICTIIIELAY